MKYVYYFLIYCLFLGIVYYVSNLEEEKPVKYIFEDDKETFLERKAFLDKTYQEIRADRLSKKFEKKDQATLTKMIDEKRIVYHRRYMINTLEPLRYDNTLVIHCDSRIDEDDIIFKSILFKYREATMDESATFGFLEQLYQLDFNTVDTAEITSERHPLAKEVRNFNNRRFVLLVDDIINTNPLVLDMKNFASGLIFARVHVIDLKMKENIDYFHIYAKNLDEVKIVGNRNRGKKQELDEWLQKDLKETFYATLLFTSYYVVHDADMSKRVGNK